MKRLPVIIGGLFVALSGVAAGTAILFRFVSYL